MPMNDMHDKRVDERPLQGRVGDESGTGNPGFHPGLTESAFQAGGAERS